MRHVLCAAAALFFTVPAASAAPMYVHDSVGILGKVDTGTGAVSVIGDLGVTLTDIAFDPLGRLFGVSFTDLYSVDVASAATTLIGGLGISGANALVFGKDGTLYSAGTTSGMLYTIDPLTGASTALGDTGFASGGDLAFVGSDLFLASTSGQLVRLDQSTPSASVAVGSFGLSSVFGIATDSADTLFGVGGTTIFSVDPTNAATISSIDFGGQGLNDAFGQSFLTEAGAPEVPTIPLPASGLLLLGALAAFKVRRRG